MVSVDAGIHYPGLNVRAQNLGLHYYIVYNIQKCTFSAIIGGDWTELCNLREIFCEVGPVYTAGSVEILRGGL